MVMPMTCSNGSMFPPSPYSYKEFADDCNRQFGVWPREHWITTEFGGMRINLVLKRFGSNIIFSMEQRRVRITWLRTKLRLRVPELRKRLRRVSYNLDLIFNINQTTYLT
ncbi:unnamed protein product [Coffea canephora]|uniref:Uncharacterized protein n=1 Tax=Coffea canephora TaxID=49390 RepID=A0A068URJ8_COFCA|nr:unnamed protein product [Coffea canephora]